MNAKQYCRRVKRALSLPAKEKRRILRDLEEIFRSAEENGESEIDVIKRLGSPAEFAAGYGSSQKFRPIGSILLAGCAVILFLLAAISGNVMDLEKETFGVIGGADGPTRIYVSSAFSWGSVFGWTGGIFLIAALALLLISIIRYRRDQP